MNLLYTRIIITYLLNQLMFPVLEKIAQIIWSFMPIGLMLLGNAIFFGLMIKDICHLDEQQRNLHGAHRTPKMDRYVCDSVVCDIIGHSIALHVKNT